MAPLDARRSFHAHHEVLSVVALVVAYAALTIALVNEWGRIVPEMARGVVDADAPAITVRFARSGEEP